MNKDLFEDQIKRNNANMLFLNNLNYTILSSKKALLTILLFILMGTFARADQINALRFQNAYSTQAFSVEDGLDPKQRLGGNYKGLFSVTYESAQSLLPVIPAANVGPKILDIIEKFQRIRFTTGYYVNPRLFLGATLPIDNIRALQPFSLNNDNSNLASLNYTDSGFILGDAGFVVKYRLSKLNQDLFNITAYANLHIPTGDEQWFNTDASYKGTLGIAASRYLSDQVRLYGNVGFILASNSILRVDTSFNELDARRRVNLGLGLGYDLTKNVNIFTEIASQISLPLDEFQNPMLLNIGANIDFKPFLLFGGVGLEGPLLNENSENRFFVGAKLHFGKVKDWHTDNQAPVVATSTNNNIASKDTVESYPVPDDLDDTLVASVPPVQERVVEKIVEVPREQMFNRLQEAIKIARRVNFQTGKAIIIPTYYHDLDQVISLLHQLKDYVSLVKVEGHTDTRGDAAKNMALSQQRAQAIVNYFVQKGQLSRSLFESRGYGESKPLVEEVDADSQRINRRVEIFVEKVKP